eukprot:173599_1
MKLLPFTLVIATATAIKYKVPQDATCLSQSDFANGTKIITESGNYKLCENISFNPNAPEAGKLPNEDAFDPLNLGPEGYSPFGYGLGFFAALCVVCSDVSIYLNNFKIEQSPGHALMQRYFAIFELSSSPFIRGVGPSQFVGDDEVFAAANNIKIIGPGEIGRSSHHGIHGNENTKVKISEVTFSDFEVAAVSLNNVDSLEISGCKVINNRHDVPVVGLFSAARFLRPYGKYLKGQGYRMKKLGTAAKVYNKMIASISNVYEDVIINEGTIDSAKHPDEYRLFHNPKSVVDGPCYAFLVHGKGPAVGGQGDYFDNTTATTTSSNVVIKDNTISNIKCWNNEVPALYELCEGEGCIMHDPRGAIFQTIKTFDQDSPYLAMDSKGRYRGNVVSDMQIMVAQAIIDGVLQDMPDRQTKPNSINQDIVKWAIDKKKKEPQYVCNGDSMHHVMKGIIPIRVEETAGFLIEGNTIANIENKSFKPFSKCIHYHAFASYENENQFQGGNVRAISVAAVRGYGNGNRNAQIKDNKIFGADSDQDDVVVIGIDVQGDSKDMKIVGNFVNVGNHLSPNKDPNDKFISLRVRKDAQSITLEKNNFMQETQILNKKNIRGLKRQHAHLSHDIEWKVGGCPFASQYAKN